MNKKTTIVIDPGHGLKKNGKFSRPLMDCTGEKVKIVSNSMKLARTSKTEEGQYSDSKYYREDFGTLFLAKAIRKELEDKYNILLTRKDIYDAKINLSKNCTSEWKLNFWGKWKWIVDFTNKNKADIFISLHTNAGGGKGCSAFWESAPEGEKLSKSITSRISEELNIKVRRIKKHRYMVLRNKCKGKSILLEVLFHDNINEIKYLLEQEGIEKVAKVIAAGIDNYASTL